MSWTATRGGKRSNGDGTVNKATEFPFLSFISLVSRSVGGRGGRSCLQARGTGSMAVKAARSWQLRQAKFSVATNCFPARRQSWTRAVRFRPQSRPRDGREYTNTIERDCVKRYESIYFNIQTVMYKWKFYLILLLRTLQLNRMNRRALKASSLRIQFVWKLDKTKRVTLDDRPTDLLREICSKEFLLSRTLYSLVQQKLERKTKDTIMCYAFH